MLSNLTAAEAAEATSVAEEKLPEATSGMAEDTANGACVLAAAPQPARFSLPFSGWNRPTNGLPGGRPLVGLFHLEFFSI